MVDLRVIHETNLKDVAATLRNIATEIEAGTYGKPQGCVLVLDADDLGVFYMGLGEAAPNAHLLLAAGGAKMLRAVLDGKPGVPP
jgi:hypothetical protein